MRRAFALHLAAALLLSTAGGCAATRRLRPFTTDGCSAFPDEGLGQPRGWRACCVAHDMAYWRGGAAAERAAADEALARCVEAATGSGALAATMYAGVRAGGTAWLPTSFRWGYGWRSDRPDAPLTDLERAIAEEAIDRWLRDHPEGPTPPWRRP